MRALAFALPLLMLAATAAPAKDIAGSRDHPLVGRYTGSEISQYRSSDFDEVRLLNRALDLKRDGEKLTAENSIALEGKVVRIRYDAPKDRSSLEILKNYEESLKARGFEIVFTCGNETCLSGDNSFYRLSAVFDDGAVNYRYAKGARYVLAKLARPQGDVYAGVLVGDGTAPIVKVTAVEIKPIESGRIAFIDAGAMEKSIAATGRVALYGIQFDTDKAEIKPESGPTLAEISKFMKASPSVSLIVTGHADNQGAFDYNVDLSRRRAAAVVAHLVRTGGIAQTRLTPFGAGMAAPVAANEDEAGRAKNRRVELVKR